MKHERANPNAHTWDHIDRFNKIQTVGHLGSAHRVKEAWRLRDPIAEHTRIHGLRYKPMRKRTFTFVVLGVLVLYIAAIATFCNLAFDDKDTSSLVALVLGATGGAIAYQFIANYEE